MKKLILTAAALLFLAAPDVPACDRPGLLGRLRDNAQARREARTGSAPGCSAGCTGVVSVGAAPVIDPTGSCPNGRCPLQTGPAIVGSQPAAFPLVPRK